jgi:hypothetical protein
MTTIANSKTIPHTKPKTGQGWTAACFELPKKVLDYYRKYGIIVSAETDRNRGALLLSAIENHNIFIVGKAPLVSGFASRYSSQQRWQPNKGRFAMFSNFILPITKERTKAQSGY